MRPIRNACRLLLPLMLLLLGRGEATQIQLKDGRILEGKIGKVGGLAMAPLAINQESTGPQLIDFLDDDLRRTYVSHYQVEKVLDEQPGEILEKFVLHQQVLRNGHAVKSVGPPVRVDPFDEYGRRIFVMYTAQRQVAIIQVITEITPKWTKVEGHDYVWDMRMATSSIPRETLAKILNHLINRKDIEQRKKVARFYLQCERDEEAEEELKSIVADFPDPAVKAELTNPLRVLRQLSTQRLIGELKLRRESGQYNLVLGALKKFPTDTASGQSLQAARSMLSEYETYQADRAALLKDFDALAAHLEATTLKNVQEIRYEIDRELTPSTMGRMAAFRQMGGDASLQPDDRLALAISGWLFGENSAVPKLSVALSAYKVRGLVQKYLNTPDVLGRRKVLDEFHSEEAASPSMVAKIIAAMKPAVQTPEPSGDAAAGCYELEIVSQGSETPVTYYVQLPPEYDPLRRYPAIFTLRGAGTVTAPQQIDWWAGEVKHGVRNGQAGRNGYIVIAPEWLAEHQKEYHYSAREHAAVLDTLRDACRRFSIDTDRVFLSGHSCGGDAAWDIGLSHPDLWAGVIPIVGPDAALLQPLLGECQAAALLPGQRRTGRPQDDRQRRGHRPLHEARLQRDRGRVSRPGPRALFRRDPAAVRLDGALQAELLPQGVQVHVDAALGQFLLVARPGRDARQRHGRPVQLAAPAGLAGRGDRGTDQRRQRAEREHGRRPRHRLALAGDAQSRSQGEHCRRGPPRQHPRHFCGRPFGDDPRRRPHPRRPPASLLGQS